MSALLALFAIVHSGLASIRTNIVNIIGERLYRVIFAISSLTMAGICIGFFIGHRYDGYVLWRLQGQAWTSWVVASLSVVSFGFLYPGTFDLLSIAAIKKPKLRLFQDVGVLRITRHPQLWGQIIWCIGHEIWLGSSFGMVACLGLIAHHLFGAWHGDRRLESKYGKEWRDYARRTSILPFGAAFDGRQDIRWSEFVTPAYVGVAAFVVAIYKAHPLMLRIVGSGPF